MSVNGGAPKLTQMSDKLKQSWFPDEAKTKWQKPISKRVIQNNQQFNNT